MNHPTIRRSTAADLPEMIALWESVFGDPPAFTERFYAVFGADCAIVAKFEGKIAAMVHPLPTALAARGQYTFGVYIYALCTAPDYRGQGIASALLQAAETFPFPKSPQLEGAQELGLTAAENRSPAFSLLIPAEDSLFDYYRARGYTLPARVTSDEPCDYPAQLLQGLSDAPVFLKPEPFFTFAAKFPEPTPPPVERALWKPLFSSLLGSEIPTLSHFMQ